ncbi:MAG: putative Ig domain-containing protein [Verrucomicrobia bacterium]|nr:putative Ig domain-containing protein [Verrucomicrobiota bacterium]
MDHVGESNTFNHADWAEPRFVVAGAKPRTVNAPAEKKVILTPKPPRAPHINGPKVYGCRPGHPFIYRIPTTGERPIRFTADGLPASLRLDAETGIITGTAPARGEFTVTFHAKNRHGSATRTLKIVSGDTLALTPPMGWNHWYAHYNRVTDVMMREAADVMVRTGMADVGYSYVNIDDCWMNATPDAKRTPDPLRVGPFRDAAGNILPNKYFPDMRAMTDYIHARGLKAGIYTSPGPLTCAGYCGAYQHEEQDARLFAEWGFDFLKYDWCSYSHIAEGKDPKAKNIYLWGKTAPSLQALQHPYRLMGSILQRLPRDIVFNLCQYGMGDVWEWGAEIGGHCWRTAGDLGAELNRIFAVALKNAEYRQWSKPGAWNDPDYIQIGFIGDARTSGAPKPCPLTPTEQYSFMSLWSLMAAPLFYSGDMSQLDPFTLNVLCNPEVIEVNQDPLGDSAAVVKLTDDTFLMVKRMEDGSKAVGLCNRGETKETVTAKWSDIGITGKKTVRDLWRQRDLGKFDGQFTATVPRHGVVLVRVR